jgi:CO dehydrogenase maturation factor
LKVACTVGGAREDMKKGDVPSGMTKDIFMEMRLEEAIVEGDGFDLIVMGQPEGAGCYCAANSLLTNFLDRIQGNYPYVVLDNEAGMEHISRLTTKNVDVLLVVSDTSRRSIQAAVRINKLAAELNIVVGKTFAVINQAKQPPSATVLDILQQDGLELAGTVPADDAIYEFDLNGRPTIELPESNQSVQTAFQIFDKIIG